MEQERSKRAVAIKLRQVSKEYRLGEIGGKTLQHELQSWWAEKRGKTDPNLPIGVTKAKGERFLALSDIDLTVYEGEILGIIGRNGSGKSTLLKLICQITAPSTGSIDIYGRITSMLEVGTGFHGEMTGRENIYMNGAILGMTPREIDAKLEEIISFSELEQFIDTPVKRYSSGMYVKLGFAVAAHLDSEIVVMDEVLAVGDAAFQRKCLDKMRAEAANKNRTVLYVSHNMQTIRQLCDRCAVLENGKLRYLGDVDTAIGMYMQRQEQELCIDYTGKPQIEWLKMPGLFLQTAEYRDRKNIRFEKEEPVRFRLRWKNLLDITELGLRVELRTMDDEPQGIYAKTDFYQGRAGEEAEAEIELDTHGLAPALYRMVYTFFRIDAFGNNINLECRLGLGFELLSNDYPGSWDKRNWGYHLMDGMHVTLTPAQNSGEG